MTTRTLWVFLGLFSVGCVGAPIDDLNDTDATTLAQIAADAAKAKTLSSTTTSLLVSKYYVAVRGLNLNNWLNCFAKDAILDDPFGQSMLQGQQNIAGAYQGAIDSFSVLDMREKDVFTPDQTDQAAIRWTANLTFKNGLKVDPFNGITTITFNENGKIKLLKAFWDPAVLVNAHY